MHVRLATWLKRWHIREAAAHLDVPRALAHGDDSMSVTIGHEYRLAGEFESCVATLDEAVAQKDGGEAQRLRCPAAARWRPRRRSPRGEAVVPPRRGGSQHGQPQHRRQARGL